MIYAEDLPYWKTGSSSPDVWIERTIRVLAGLGGKIQFEAFGKDSKGQAAFLLNVQIGAETYRIVWPVLPSKTGNERAARIQAATMLYHDCKSRAVSAMVLGTKSAFFTFLQLPNGRTPAESLTEDVSRAINIFSLPSGQDETVDGEIREIHED